MPCNWHKIKYLNSYINLGIYIIYIHKVKPSKPLYILDQNKTNNIHIMTIWTNILPAWQDAGRNNCLDTARQLRVPINNFQQGVHTHTYTHTHEADTNINSSMSMYAAIGRNTQLECQVMNVCVQSHSSVMSHFHFHSNIWQLHVRKLSLLPRSVLLKLAYKPNESIFKYLLLNGKVNGKTLNYETWAAAQSLLI